MKRRTKCLDCPKLAFGKRCYQCMLAHRRSLASETRQRFWHIQKKYGLTEDEFWVYWNAGRGRCYICSRDMELPKQQRGQSLASCCVDHDHKTNKVRGLLCSGCNKGIGLLKEDPQILIKAVQYLTCVN